MYWLRITKFGLILGVFVNVIIDYDSYNVMLMIDGQIDALMRIDCI